MNVKLNVSLILITISFYAKAQLIQYQILPNVTDPNINTFTSAGQQHFVFLNNSVLQKNQLFIMLPGTNQNPSEVQRIDSLAANLGYHSIGLSYPNNPAIGTLCNSSSDIDCYTNTRLEIIDGTDRTTLVTVDSANCIENRIIKLLQYLQLQNSSENWSQFLDTTGNIIWDKIVIAGQSQGGGHAGVIAKYHKVARVLFFASPKDFSTYFSNPANWIDSTNQTPANRYFAFAHSSDNIGCTFSQLQMIYTNFGMSQFGSAVNTDSTISPYNNSHILTSTIPESSANAHRCVVDDSYVPLDINNIPIYRPVWVYMLNSDILTGMIENDKTDNISISPNPTSDELRIHTTKIADKQTMQILNYTGQILYDNSNFIGTSLDTRQLPNGIYLLKYSDTKSLSVKKFVVQH